jgi:hypothetical protein
MKTEFLNKLTSWYGSRIQRHDVIVSTENDAVLLVAYRDSQKILRFEIVRIFMIGNSVEISIDESINASHEINMDTILKLIKAAINAIN